MPKCEIECRNEESSTSSAANFCFQICCVDGTPDVKIILISGLVYLIGMHVMGVYIMDVHLMRVHLMGIHFMGRRAPHGGASHGRVPHGGASHGCVAYGGASHGRAPHGRVPYGRTPHRQASFSKVKALILVHRRGVVLGLTHAVVFPLHIAHCHTHSAGATDADRRPCYGECRRKICLVGHAAC
jgi:hypothetical protein